MSDENENSATTPDNDCEPEWDLDRVRPITRSLIEAITFDIWPSVPACADFGIRSQEHYEAIYYPAMNDEISFGQLDAAYGNGPKLTELVNAAPSNPHKGIRFETVWDKLHLDKQDFSQRLKRLGMEERQQEKEQVREEKDQGRER